MSTGSLVNTNLVVMEFDQDDCPICKKPLCDRVDLAEEKLFHASCLKCSQCDNGLGDGYGGSLSKPYCSECWTRSNRPKCNGCSKPFNATSCIEVLGKHYHRECMKCSDCRQSFKDAQSSFLIDGVACCLDCHWRRRLGTSSSSCVQDGDKSGGGVQDGDKSDKK